MSKFTDFNQTKIIESKLSRKISQLTPTQKFENLISAIKRDDVNDALEYIANMSTNDLNQSDPEGKNCLHWAVLKNNQRVVKALCIIQTDCISIKMSDYAINLIDNYGYSALNYASIYGFVDLAYIIFNDSYYTKIELMRKMKEDGNYTEDRLIRYCRDNDFSILARKMDEFDVKNLRKFSNCIDISKNNNFKINNSITELIGEIDQSHFNELTT